MKPDWLKIKPPKRSFENLKKILQEKGLNTVCQSSHCPNITKCWDNNTATFLILGNICTRSCKFCAVTKGKPKPLNTEESKKIAETAKQLNLKYVVLTSVDRDDLLDKGANHFASCINELKKREIKVEVLIPDYQEKELKIIVDEEPEIIAHNIEVVKRLQPSLRDRRASYESSLNTLKIVKKLNKKIYTKSSIMLGLGETKEEIIEAMKDLRRADVDFLTLGQYLAPSSKHAEVQKYVRPEEFSTYQKIGKKLGFKAIASGPFVRSSFQAKELFSNVQNN